MMDCDRLAGRLRGGWTALLIAAGCTGTQPEAAKQVEAKQTEPPVVAKPEVVVEPTKQVEPPQPVVADPPDVGSLEPMMNTPSCPSGTWSGPQALARKIKQNSPVKQTKDGCPDLVRASGKLSAAEIKLLMGLPGNAYGSLDAQAMLTAEAGTCVYRWSIPCPGGRVLVGEHGVVLAEVRAGEGEGEVVDAALAEAWLLDARVEHASIASFARATLELMALAAPLNLVSATQQASLDEVEHARVCFALASRYAGQVLGPGPLPAVAPRATSLVRLACDVFVEGCVGETIAALAVARARNGCEVEEVRAVLEKIEGDETRHAALAWATLGWALERGGYEVRVAVLRLADRMRGEVFAEEIVTGEADARRLAQHGRLDAAAQQVCVRDAWVSIIPRALAELVGQTNA